MKLLIWIIADSVLDAVLLKELLLLDFVDEKS